MRDLGQSEFHFRADPFACQHRFGFITMACVPCGYVCSDCEHLIWQYVPEPPEVVGHLTATWAWKQSGKAFTTL